MAPAERKFKGISPLHRNPSLHSSPLPEPSRQGSQWAHMEKRIIDLRVGILIKLQGLARLE